jgi:hypothetical protein
MLTTYGGLVTEDLGRLITVVRGEILDTWRHL